MKALKPRRDSRVARKGWCHLPKSKSYLLVFMTNAAATALLWPRDRSPDRCPSEMRVFFFGLMLSSFGAGCVAAFLLQRFHASSHTQSACVYAMINWFQAMLGSLGMTRRANSRCLIKPGSAFAGSCIYGLVNDSKLAYGLLLCRSLLFLVGLLWMQVLVLSRLEFLEQSSNQKYCSRCFRGLVWAQVILGVAVILPSLYWDCLSSLLLSTASWGALLASTGVAVIFLCNVAASIVAIYSFSKSSLQLRRICLLAEAQETCNSVKFSLRRARYLAGWQAVGVSFSLLFILLLLPARAMHTFFDSGFLDQEIWTEKVQTVCFLVLFLDPLGNGFAVLLLSGSHRLAKTEGIHGIRWRSGSKFVEESPTEPISDDPNWTQKVKELSSRGMTLRSLLRFALVKVSMEELGWKYIPEEHKTRDVVRRVIIPLTRSEECAYAVSSHNEDGPRRPQVMVTHNWGNHFHDLLAAVLSDALQECSFSLASQLLREDCVFLQKVLGEMGRLDETYWICAFAVNQHVSICHRNPYDRDPLTNLLHPVCNCSCVNISDPDGRSVESEINKFDDMMCHLAATGKCRQVIAVDQCLDLFHRAWCVAEIAEARRLQMDQSLKLSSKATLQQRAQTLENLDVREMQASCERDKELILGRIQDIDDFNAKVQVLIFDPKSGLVASWNAMDSLQQLGEVGRLIKWGLADAGSGRVWKAWDPPS